MLPAPLWTHGGHQRDGHPSETRPDHEDATAAFREAPPALLTASKSAHESINPTFWFFFFVSIFPSHLPIYSPLLSQLVFLYPHKSMKCSSCFSWGWSGFSRSPCGEPSAGQRAPARCLPRSRAWHSGALMGPEEPAQQWERRDLESHTSCLEHGGQSLEDIVGPS